MNIAEHPVWAELAEKLNNRPMPKLHFQEIGPGDLDPPSDPGVVAAFDDLGKGRIDLQGFVYRMVLLEIEDELNR